MQVFWYKNEGENRIIRQMGCGNRRKQKVRGRESCTFVSKNDRAPQQNVRLWGRWMSDVCPCGRLLNLLAGGAVAGAVGHEDEEIAVFQNLLRLLFVHRHEDNGFVKRAVVRIGNIIYDLTIYDLTIYGRFGNMDDC